MKPSSPAGSQPTPDRAPDLDEILRYFSGAARMMGGQSEGLKHLDLSADGFWRSFFALPVALPPTMLAWIQFETMEHAIPRAETGTLLAYGAHALADLLSWLLPILALMMIARHIGFSRKIVPLVVATNWGGAFLAWVFSPYWLFLMLAGVGSAAAALGTLVTIASIVLTVRLVYVAIGRDLAAAIGIVALMIVASLVSYGAVMDVTGVTLL